MSFIFSQKNFCEFFSIHADFKKTLFHHRGIFTLFYLSLLAIFPPQRANKFHYIIKKRKKKDRVCKLKKTRLIRAKICFSSQNISSYSFPTLIIPLNCNCTFSRNYLATLQRLFLFLFQRFKAGSAKSNICEKLSDSLTTRSTLRR